MYGNTSAGVVVGGVLLSGSLYMCRTVECICILHLAALNELFTRHLLAAEEFSEVARKESWKWEDHLALVLSTKPAEVVQEGCQVMEKHGCDVVEELKSELYYSSTLCQVCFKYCIMPT